jgi:hypothetical protein
MNPHARHKDISAHLRIDGVKTQGKAVRQPKKRCHFEGPIDRNKQCRPYIFQKPVSLIFKSVERMAASSSTMQELRVEDGDDESETTINTAIGTLEISLCRVQYHPQYKPYTHREVANLTSALSEKHKKGLLTCVTQ